MNKNKLALFIFTGILSLGVCTSAAAQVRIGKGPIPRGCKFLGNVGVVTQDINGGTHAYTEASQQIDLKNQATKLGANLIVINSHKAAYYPEYFTELGEFRNELEGDALAGKAYRCPN